MIIYTSIILTLLIIIIGIITKEIRLYYKKKQIMIPKAEKKIIKKYLGIFNKRFWILVWLIIAIGAIIFFSLK